VKFGPAPLNESVGAIVAHALRIDGLVLKKGDVIDAAHVRALEAAGVREIVVAQMEEGDVSRWVSQNEFRKKRPNPYSTLVKRWNRPCMMSC
jgi:molybdenum cofactor cytidylyltransferase